MIQHTCGTVIPPDVETYVRHLAACTETRGETGGVCRAIVNAVEHEMALNETPTETRDVSREMTPSQMAAMRDRGLSLRGIAAAAGVAPETVRRRIAKHKTEAGL